MKKLSFFLILLILLSLSISKSEERMMPVPENIFPNRGNVGIGTRSPEALLDIRKVTTEDFLLRIRANYAEDGSKSTIRFDENDGLGFLLGYLGHSENAFYLDRHDGRNLERVMTIPRVSGNIGIGTRDPGAKLDVAGTTRTSVLQITGGSDLAEPFEIAGAESIKPGMVVSIDPEHPGQLLIADKAYDRTVAGIVSGANGLNPGLTMKQEGSTVDGSLPVALTGRVYCWVDASNGSIQPGDLLTTSDTPGHAMKVTDYTKAQGAIIGKAMSSLETGQGLVLVLVSLQ